MAPTEATVLLRGNRHGQGGRAIHHQQPRENKPFVRVNCAALADEVLESELFGHEKGAFTGATARRPGRFELADQGTLFLDEVGDLPAPVQVKLLRVLQENEFERVGEVETISVDVRVVAATHRNLEAMIEAGEFREDLYYRLNVFEVNLPPLRDRTGDLPILAEHFVQKYARRARQPVEGFRPGALARLAGYDWPGNVRELENVVERAMILAGDPRSPRTIWNLGRRGGGKGPGVARNSGLQADPTGLRPCGIDAVGVGGQPCGARFRPGKTSSPPREKDAIVSAVNAAAGNIALWSPWHQPIHALLPDARKHQLTHLLPTQDPA